MEKTIRGWGYYIVLQELEGYKLKELVVNPNSCLSYQRHKYRSELWFVKSGKGKLILNDNIIYLSKHDYILINPKDWHQIINGNNENLIITEIQFGSVCEEEDIERR